MIKQLLDKAPFISRCSNVGGYGQYKFNFPAMNFGVNSGKGNITTLHISIAFVICFSN